MPHAKDARRNVCLNRKARYEYELEDRHEAGLVLTGSEVKSLRGGGGNLDDAWVGFDGRGRAMLYDAHIAPYVQANRQNHEPRRPRPLLLHGIEVERLHQKVKERGYTLVPLQLYFKGAWCKVEFALGKGRKRHDKRQAEREHEDRREMRRAMRGD